MAYPISDIDSIFASLLPEEPSLEEIDDSLIGVVFRKAREVPTTKNIRQFTNCAKTLSLDFEKFDKYLSILQRANIVSAEARDKALIIHAVTLGQEQRALNLLAAVKIAPVQFLLSLMVTEQLTEPLVKLLTKNGLNFLRQEFSIATLDTVVSLGADINCLKIEGRSLFFWSVVNGHEPLFRFLASRGAKICIECFFDERCRGALGTLLSLSSEEQTERQLLDALIRCGFDYQSSKVAFLGYALHLQDHALLECLLTSEGALFLECEAGKTTFEMLFGHAQPKMRALLQEIAPNYTTLPFAPVTNAMKAVKDVSFSTECKAFLEALCRNVVLDRFFTDEGVELVLHLFYMRSLKCILILFERGYDVDRVQIEGVPLWQYFVQQKNGQAIAILIAEKKLSIETKLQDGSTLLFWLLSLPGSWNPAEFLRAKGVCLSGRGANNAMLLHHLLTKNHNFANFQTVLDENRAEVNVVDQAGKTALYYALSVASETEQSVAVVSALLRAGSYPFHLGERIVRYVNHVRQNRYQDVVGKSALWKQFEAVKSVNFRDWLLSQDFRYQSFDARVEVLECAFLLPQLAVNLFGFFLNSKDYLAGLMALRKRYPEAPLAYFLDYLLKIDVRHVKKVTSDPFVLALDGFRKEILSKLCESDPAKYRRFGFMLICQFADYYETRAFKNKNPALESALDDFSLVYTPGAIFTFATSYLESQLAKDKAKVMQWFKESPLSLVDESGKISKEAILWLLAKHNVLQERYPGLFSQFLKSSAEEMAR